jgi:integrase
MARKVNRLSARRVATLRRPGYYPDGGNLWLQVSKGAAKSWIFRFTLNGRAREMGLGSLDTFSLVEARGRAVDSRKQLDGGIDPIEARNALLQQRRLEDAKALTFMQCAEKYIEAHRKGWRNAKHAQQWQNTLKTYAEKLIGALPVQAIDTALVLRVVEPIWHTKPETASRVRGRTESILDWATARGLRSGDNPARWRGHLENLLPARKKISAVKHHAALPYTELGDFMTKLREQEGTAARVLEFVILTAARTGEAIGAKKDEFDLPAKVWNVPASRMKMGRDHRVPLSPRVIKIVQRLSAVGDGRFVFPGGRAKRPLSNMAMLALLERMSRGDLTVHGFRSTFSDWVAEQTAYPWEVREAALAHAKGDKVEAAYQRGDLFDKRRQLMNDWAKFCELPSRAAGKVIPMRKRRVA